MEKWKTSKLIRFRFFQFTNFFIYGFGFAYPKERDEFFKELNKNETWD